MIAKNFSLELDGDWQNLPVEDFFAALQIRNPAGNSDLLFKYTADGVQDTIEAGKATELITPNFDEPFRNDSIKVKGTNGETITGEQWLYDYQVS